MKKEFLKMAGVEKESDFYKLFPTEEAFFGMYPEAKKLVQKKYGGLVKAQIGVQTPPSSDANVIKFLHDAIGITPDSPGYGTDLDEKSAIAFNNWLKTNDPEAYITPEELKEDKLNIMDVFWGKNVSPKESAKRFAKMFTFDTEHARRLKKLLGINSPQVNFDPDKFKPPTSLDSDQQMDAMFNSTFSPNLSPRSSPNLSPRSSEAMFADQDMDAMFNEQFPTTDTTTKQSTFGDWFNQNVKEKVIEPPRYKDIYGNDMPQTWQGVRPPKSNKRYLFGKVGEWVDKNQGPIMGTAKTLNMAFALGNTLSAQKQYSDFLKSYQKNLRNKIFTNPVMPSVSGFRGDYVTNTGAFRPNDYTVNKGMYTSNMPGAIVGTQQFSKFGGPIMQLGGGVIEEQIIPSVPEFSPIITPPPFSSEQLETEDVESSSPKTKGEKKANPIAEQTWKDISGKYAGVKFLGIWGDPSHQKRESDHNTGNALDIGIINTEQGDKIAEQLISEAKDKNIKYLIFNRKIWSPNKGWQTYTPTKANGNNPHTTHVHVSFEPFEESKVERKAGESIAVSHNNPGNIHYSKFTDAWGAKKGDKDVNGNVAIFNTIDEGWEALNKKLFGKGYAELSVVQARNKWVTGDPNNFLPSSKALAKELGVDENTKVADLSPDQQLKLASLFVRHEDGNMYKKMKKLKYFEHGGQVDYAEGEEYDLTEDQIKQILENGGNIEFI